MHHRADEMHADGVGVAGAEGVGPELGAFLLRPGIGALVDRDDELGDRAQDLEGFGFFAFH